MSLIDVVLDDLVILRDTWNDDDITEARLRNDSVILRKLLVDGLLGRAWHESNHKGEPRVLAPDLKSFLGDFDRIKIPFVQAGGATYRGVELSFMMVLIDTPEPPGAGYELVDGSPYRPLQLSRFVEGPSIVAAGVTAKRREVIKYVSNKLGGAHYDPNRDWNDLVFRALDGLKPEFVRGNPFGLDCRYFEMLAIGQLIVGSPDISNWIESSGR